MSTSSVESPFVIRDGILVPKDEVTPLDRPKPDRAYILKAQKTNWETPRKFFDDLWNEFDGFDLDPACQKTDYTASRILAKGGIIMIPDDDKPSILEIQRDGLKQPWHGKVYLNPPYGDEEVNWIRKAYEETQNGNANLVVALLPVRTDTKRWHNYIHGKAQVRFIKGRLRFVGAPASAPFPSCIVIWRKPVTTTPKPVPFPKCNCGGKAPHRSTCDINVYR